MKGRVFAIGASADGIAAISHVLSGLPREFPSPIFVVQHVGRDSPGYLPTILDRAGPLPAMHPHEGQRIEAGKVYVAPPNQHMLVRGETVHLSSGPEENYCRPSVDVLFRSVAVEFGPAAVGIVLTGYLSDGTVGLLAIKDRGGVTVVQDPEQAGAPMMVRSVLARMTVDHVRQIEDMAPLLVELANDSPGQPHDAPPLELEDRVAGGEGSRAELDEVLVKPRTALRCPMCDLALYAIEEPRVGRFRCTSGHAFTEFSLESCDVRP